MVATCCQRFGNYARRPYMAVHSTTRGTRPPLWPPSRSTFHRAKCAGPAGKAGKLSPSCPLRSGREGSLLKRSVRCTAALARALLVGVKYRSRSRETS